MKLRVWISIIIFVSSYSPLGLILFIKDTDKNTIILRNPWISLPILFISLISIIILFFTMKSIKQGDLIKINKVTNKSSDLMNYAIPYIISFFDFNLGDWQELSSFFIFMSLMYLLVTHTENIFINPILAILGYKLYDLEFLEGGKVKQAIFLSEYELKTDDTCLVRRLSYFLYFVTKMNPEE